LIALGAIVGMALSQSGTPWVAGTGRGSFPSSSAGQRNLNVTCFLLVDIGFSSLSLAPIDYMEIAVD
jgi:hypothetical protein